MSIYETYRTLTVNTATTVDNLVWSPNTYYVSDPLAFHSYGLPPEVQANPWATEGAALPETDMAWLKRRVAEISWVPA